MVNQVATIWSFSGLLSLLPLLMGIVREFTLVTALGLFGLILLGFLLALFILINFRSTNFTDTNPIEYLYKLSQTKPSDNLATIDLGRRWPAITLSRHLTSGRMVVIDVYNPQLMPAKSLIRSQQQHLPATQSDPRLFWYDSSIDLLPLPDRSVSAVFLYHVLSEIEERGDQVTLLNEIGRILEPGGRLLIAEFAPTGTNRLRSNLGIIRLHTADYWRKLLQETDYKLQQTNVIQSITICIRGDKSSPYVGRQMSLNLDFEAY